LVAYGGCQPGFAFPGFGVAGENQKSLGRFPQQNTLHLSPKRHSLTEGGILGPAKILFKWYLAVPGWSVQPNGLEIKRLK